MPADTPTTGVLLTNLGTPQAPTSRALRRYLCEFLSDRRVIEMPRVLWWPILHGFILPTRPRQSAAAYRKVWQPQGSPLLLNAQAQADAVRAALVAQYGNNIALALGMRYGEPSLGAALESLRNRGCQRIVVLPLYPQYSATTTGSTFDALSRHLRGWRALPSFDFLGNYHAHPAYIAALAASVREYRHAHGAGEKLLMSFHGLPQSYVDKGDPYARQCLASAKLLADTLGLADEQWDVAFQSRLGRTPWLKPYTDEVVRQYARDGVRRIDVVCPGFSADCLETLEEVALRNQRYFQQAGGDELNYIPALNTRDDHIAMLVELLSPYLDGTRV